MSNKPSGETAVMLTARFADRVGESVLETERHFGHQGYGKAGPPRDDGGGVSGGFSGDIYLKGVYINLAATGAPKLWIHIAEDIGQATWNDGPPPVPFPAFDIWYKTANTYGDIVIP